MSSEQVGELADELAARALNGVRCASLDRGSAVGALAVAMATLIALSPESEWDDIVRSFSENLPSAIRARAVKLQEAGIVASRAGLN